MPSLLRHKTLIGTLLAMAVAWVLAPSIAPRQIARQIDRLAIGSPAWIADAAVALADGLIRMDRGAQLPASAYPAWSPPSGLPSDAMPTPRPATSRAVMVGSNAELLKAVNSALPGDTITLRAGDYPFSGRGSIAIQRPGITEAPITLRAATLGEVRLAFDMLEGFHVLAPHWRFENLEIRGTCRNDSACEHAFHIVGSGHHVELRRLRIVDFNAHIKVNGARDQFPDHGLLIDSELFNTRARQTGNPVTPFDLVAASHWRVEGNLIADFVKAGGDRISYGAFVKGGGSGNVLVRNRVLCEHRLRHTGGQRVGLSLGGGGTSLDACRDHLCVVEQEAGAIAGNLIAQCSDAGIYLNKAVRSIVRNNTLLDTAGIEARFPETRAELAFNLIDGGIRRRDGATADEHGNKTGSAIAAMLGIHAQRRLFRDAAALDLGWQDASGPMRQEEPNALGEDLCAGPSAPRQRVGASDDYTRCLKAPAAAASQP